MYLEIPRLSYEVVQLGESLLTISIPLGPKTSHLWSYPYDANRLISMIPIVPISQRLQTK